MLSCVTRKASAKTSKAAPLSSFDSRAEILASSSLNEFTAYRPWATNSSVRGCLGTSFFICVLDRDSTGSLSLVQLHFYCAVWNASPSHSIHRHLIRRLAPEL